MLKRKGHYFGTEINEIWWKRYIKDNLFARGTGEYWYDDHAFSFRRYLTKTPIILRYENIIGLKTGSWHAGRWGGGRPIMKIIWEKHGVRLSSGFLMSKHRDVTENILEQLQQYTDAVNKQRDSESTL
jgi:hypothetical protein